MLKTFQATIGKYDVAIFHKSIYSSQFWTLHTIALSHTNMALQTLSCRRELKLLYTNINSNLNFLSLLSCLGILD